ncbi:MAG: hypothetical protein B6D61_01610 [Bacteroidetes bacterium 4484_249]|nr:MAG: hypothetical protein B6D61_01610 [Bacteroidetes bacterium 4484_249]
MSKIAYEIAKNIPWLDEVSSVNTIIFSVLFVAIVIGILRMKKSDVEEYKRLPLEDDESSLID